VGLRERVVQGDGFPRRPVGPRVELRTASLDRRLKPSTPYMCAKPAYAAAYMESIAMARLKYSTPARMPLSVKSRVRSLPRRYSS